MTGQSLSLEQVLETGSDMPAEFSGRLEGLYGWGDDEDAYARLPVDKRAALWLVSRRLIEKGLWRAVGRIVNVYGMGGVGLYFGSAVDLERELEGRPDFTRHFARHRDNTGGFLEKHRQHASLHFLYVDPPRGEREWHAHLDLYGPFGSIMTTSRHLFYERWRKFRPDWRLMKEYVE